MKLGLLAGNGSLPIAFAREARSGGHQLVAVAHRGQTLPELASWVERIRWVQLGELEGVIGAFREAGVEAVVLAGGIDRRAAPALLRPDRRGAALLQRLPSLRDDAVLRAVAEELEAEGFRVEAFWRFCPGLLTPRGVLTRRQPTQRELADARLGWEVIRALDPFDVGQAVALKQGTVLAVEALEGTDEMIARAGSLEDGAVVVKASKPSQDLRFDLPTVGPRTVEAMIRARASLLVLEAGRSVILERQAVVSRADEAGIGVMGWSP